MNQRTPFGSAEEAIKEFSTIFKQKTGNLWEEKDNFTKVEKKYILAKIRYITADVKDYLAPFDLKNCVPSALPKSVQDLFYELTHVTAFQRAMSGMNIDTHAMPFSALTKDVVIEAMKILNELEVIIEKDGKLQQ